jgi:hypothetical protein
MTARVREVKTKTAAKSEQIPVIVTAAAVVQPNPPLISPLADTCRRSNAEEKKQQCALRWRMAVCALAILLLWSTTLTLAQQIVSSTTVVPSFTSVYKTCKFAYNEVTVQQRWYEECAENQLAACAATRQESLQQGVKRLSEEQAHNTAVYEAIEHFQTTCSSNIGELFTALESHSSQIPSALVYQKTCPATLRARLQAKLGDRAATSTSTLDTSEEYVKSSHSAISSLSDYATTLSAYNQAYLSNKTSRIKHGLAEQVNDVSATHIAAFNATLRALTTQVEQLVACISLDETAAAASSSSSHDACSHFPATVVDLYANMQRLQKANKMRVTQAQSRVENAFNTYAETALAARASADSFYDSISAAGGAMDWVQSNLLSLSPTPVSLCDAGPSPSWCSFRPSQWYIYSPILPDVPDMLDVPSGSELWSQVEEAVGGVLGDNQQLVGEVLSTSELWRDALLSLSGHEMFSLDDYSPPAYAHEQANSTAEVARAHDVTSQSYLHDLTEHIANLTSALQFEESPPNSSSVFNLVADTSESAASMQSDHSFSFQSMNLFDNLDFLNLLDQFGDINQLFVWMDIIFRIFQTVRMVRKYWDKSAVSLPVVDMTQHQRGVEKGAGGVLSWLYLSLTMFGHVWVGVGVVLVVLVVALATLAGL